MTDFSVEKVENPYCPKPYIASDRNGKKVKICHDVEIDDIEYWSDCPVQTPEECLGLIVPRNLNIS